MADYVIVISLTSFAGVVITALVTWSIAQRRIAIEHVTAERAKWRKQVRTLALWVQDAILQHDEASLLRLRAEFAALLNPADRSDWEILERIRASATDQGAKRTASGFTRRISLLLKHDWDRAKLEAAFFLPRWTLEARRHGLKCDAGKGCYCRGNKRLRWSDNYDVRPLGVWLLAAIVLVPCFITAYVLWHCCRPLTAKHNSFQVLLDTVVQFF